MNSRIVLSSLSIFASVALVAGATFAFFTDEETSTDNLFEAGSIDLQVDNESYLNDVLQGDLSWDLADLDGHLFFNFSDIKPGDYGEDTISLHVFDNDAWLCADVSLTSDKDNDCTEPEDEDDVSCGTGDPDSNGDLAQELQFIWWADDGDNVLEDDEDVIVPNGRLGDLGVGNTATVTLADKNLNIFGTNGEPATGSVDYFIGKAWCFGDLTETPLPDDSDDGPAVRGAGVTCDGSSVDDASQTDSSTLDVGFTAVQSRSNPDFVCEGSLSPTPSPSPTPTPTPSPSPTPT